MKFPGKPLRASIEGVVWILLLGFVGYRMAPQVKAAFGVGAPDSAVPAVQLRTLEGDPVSLEQYRGQVVLVNFWATWCPPCRFEMPGFQRVYEDRRGEGFVVLGISTDRGGDEVVRAFLDERDITFPIAMATSEAVREFGGVQALPTSFLIDRNGRIRQEVRGMFVEPTLRMAVRRLLDEPIAAARVAGTEGGVP